MTRIFRLDILNNSGSIVILSTSETEIGISYAINTTLFWTNVTFSVDKENVVCLPATSITCGFANSNRGLTIDIPFNQPDRSMIELSWYGVDNQYFTCTGNKIPKEMFSLHFTCYKYNVRIILLFKTSINC